jgi:hypothetical protein
LGYHELGGEGVEAAAAGGEADAGEEVEVAELRAEVRRQVLLDAQPAGCIRRRQGVINDALIGMSWAACVHTEDVAGDPAVAEPAGGVVAGEVLAVGREVAADQRGEGVVVARVHDGVPEHEQRRGARLVRRRRRSIDGAAERTH